MMPGEINNLLIKPVNLLPTPPSEAKESGAKEIAQGKLKKACEDFESIFISQMLRVMRQAIPKSGLLDGGNEQDTYLSLFDEEVSKSMAQKGGIGLGKILYQNIMRQKENRNPSPAELSAVPDAQKPKNILPEQLK
jgi:Rod binding domain-containing protein